MPPRVGSAVSPLKEDPIEAPGEEVIGACNALRHPSRSLLFPPACVIALRRHGKPYR